VQDAFAHDAETSMIYSAMVACRGRWGRLPGEPSELRDKLGPEVGEMPLSSVERAVNMAVSSGLAEAYQCPWSGELALSLRCGGEGRRQFTRMGRPAFGPPPDWEVPSDLLEYLMAVANGWVSGKRVVAECAKFGVALGVVVDAVLATWHKGEKRGSGEMAQWWEMHHRPQVALERVGWQDALEAWMLGESGPQFGYEFPGGRDE
jgi:hypothetical protein